MWAGIATSKACYTAEEGTSGANSTSLTAGAEASDAASSGSWGGGLEMVAAGVWWHFWGGGMEEMEKCDMAPLKSPYIDLLPLILPLLIQFSLNPPFLATEPPPSVHLPVLTSPGPEKETNGDQHKDQL